MVTYSSLNLLKSIGLEWSKSAQDGNVGVPPCSQLHCILGVFLTLPNYANYALKQP